MVDVNLRLQSYGTLVMTSLESMRNEYVSEYEIIGDESCGRVDYAIKDEESLICVTEDKVQQKLTEGFAQNSMKRIRENESGVMIALIIFTDRDFCQRLAFPPLFSR
ncbi:hypothetical protein RclHR1_23590001 [Rhizophagus clarus]|uniref:Uncharacterized protein n=1 Tax=Rhizophagus clarus TaxID=94130 RepID=A0A2Z6R0V6_9GLOM|nr:hypothetical protein RclHR1_23590001 [Rhizophagus clarus]